MEIERGRVLSVMCEVCVSIYIYIYISPTLVYYNYNIYATAVWYIGAIVHLLVHISPQRIIKAEVLMSNAIPYLE